MNVTYGPKAIKEGKIVIHNHEPVFDPNYETIERKGLGHPDTIADALACEISRNYSLYTTKNCEGLILHHQVDKLMIVGGKSKVYFGGGEFVEPIQIYVGGRASYSFAGKNIPVRKIINQSIKSFFKKHFPLVNFKKDIVINNLLVDRPSPGTLTTTSGAHSKHMFAPLNAGQVRGYEKYVANDTSYCVAYYPYSALENALLKLEGYLNSSQGKKQFPWLGADIKTMAVREYNNVCITSCIPQISNYVTSMNEYTRNLDEISEFMYKKLSELMPDYKIELSLNTKDDYEKHAIYMTYTETSLSGEIGVVGRGNRSNGLITSNRPMSMEGTNGKNPRYYAGFIYANLSKIIAKKIWDKYKSASIVEIVSQNGGDLLDPWNTRVVTNLDQKLVTDLVKEELKNIPTITSDFLNNTLEENY